jgi:putative transcriptional regulator
MSPEAEARTSLTNLIRKLRFEHGEMTQQALAERVGVTRQTIIALEAGKYAPSLLLAFRLARAFGVGIEGVFQYHDGEPEGRGEPGPHAGR